VKTGALIGFCLEAGAIMGRLPAEGGSRFAAMRATSGLAFQITDDILDVEGEEEKTGKRVGKDGAAGKETFVSLLGVERARQQAAILVDQAIRILGFGRSRSPRHRPLRGRAGS
jgi:farnesyl diphosphate synthase